ncbi:hypothetical protein ACFLIN_03795 [Corynebacterium kutscheri]|uniref:hypothetical protein n=1 Tax=Corynebacterium kutscheri TaxID=35755 RepID=UPI0037BF727F
MAETYSFRSLPPGIREEAQARGKIVAAVLRDLRTRVMPRHKPMDIDYWLRTRGAEVIRLIALAQYDNAALVDKTWNLTLLAQGYMTEPIGAIDPGAFTGVMPDGDPLDLVPQAVANRVRERLATGAQPLQAWQAGGKLLATITQTALSDSSRMAKMVAGLARPRTLYVRMLRPPSCSRCAVLAGKRGFWEQPFQRHPGCDCSQIPVVQGSEDRFVGAAFDGQAFFDSLPASEQDKLFTRAGAEAIRSGADLAQVVNQRSGMSGVAAKTQRITNRHRGYRYVVDRPNGSVYRMPMVVDRLSVPEIIKRAGVDADKRLELLFRNGYLVGTRPGVSLDQVKKATQVRRAVGQQALREQLALDLPKIDMTVPVEHVMRSKIRVKNGNISASGGHSYTSGVRLLQVMRQHPEAYLRSSKTFFPPYSGGEKALREWLESTNVVEYVLRNPTNIRNTLNGRFIRSTLPGPDGNELELEVIVGAAGRGSMFDYKATSLYPASGRGVSSVREDRTVTGPLKEEAWT